MSASLKPLTVEEFLAWERAQPLRYEFDGTQPIGPVGMTGGSFAHIRTITRLTTALATRLSPPCEALGPDLKVITIGRVRCPDASVVCTSPQEGPQEGEDTFLPTIVFEVTLPSSALTDRRVKAAEYAAVATILAYVILEADKPEAAIRRRASGWEEEVIQGEAAVLELPEISVSVPLAEIYAPSR